MKTYLAILSALLCFWAPSLIAQQTAFTVRESDLIAEGITYDPTAGDFYISSIHKNKIIRVRKGVASDFITSGEHGFMGGVGLHVDAERRILWACSGNIMGKRMQAGLFAFSLATGALLKKVVYPLDTVRRFFNDLAILPDGSIWVTDTYGHGIWKWNLTMDLPEKLPIKGRISYPNGIVLAPDQKTAILAADEGLVRVDLASMTVSYLNAPTGNVPTRDIDGLGFIQNTLVAIQNSFDAPEKNRLVRYDLDPDLRTILSATVIDEANTLFDLPTTLVTQASDVYVIANSQLGNLDQRDNKIVDPAKLRPLVVLRYRVK
ncbi:MAG: SMP-30/gluconolactonase/LRE family protein [Cyclobacteriaceae bacterium]|nr:SMP-30/gluconolactonase/LRE family protein [Cyclobacteriaceae bacterium]